MSDGQGQPIKLLSSLVNSNFQVIDPTSPQIPPGTIVDTPTLTGPDTSLSADYNAMYALAGNNLSLVNQFFASFNSTTGNGVPGNVTDFADQYVQFLVGQGVIPNTETAINAAVTSLLNGLLTSYLASISYFDPPESTYLQGILSPPVSSPSDVDVADNADQQAILTSFWTAFSAQYSYQTNGSLTANPNTSLGFFQNLRVFTAPAATILTGSTVTVNNGSGGSVVATSANTPSYEATFEEYFPGLPTSSPLFQQYLTLFQQDMISSQGYVSPARQYTQWVSYVQNLAGITAPVTSRLPAENVDILETVLQLVIQMISAIQNSAAGQADRLSLYTAWQRGYTDLLNQVHVFTSASNDRLADFSKGNPFSDSPSLTTVQNTRQNEQGNFNAGVTQQISAYQDTVSEDAKSLQSNIDTSSNNYNNQANTASAILQEMSTILSSIFR